jgi:2,3-bisphosphoglycerate-dependent phosphoglycerate mutase
VKKTVSLVIILLVLFSCNESKNKQDQIPEATVSTTYYLIRHAEKDRSDPANKNPELTSEGIERAKHWTKYFENIKIDEIYSTDYNRTMQTVENMASEKQLTIKSYDPSDLYNVEFKKLTQGKSVLIVGHSNTTPQFVNAIIGEDKYTDIDDNENGLLFVVKLTDENANVEIVSVN